MPFIAFFSTYAMLVEDRGRAYEDVRSILNQIFIYAQNNGIITYNPVKAVAFIHHERQHEFEPILLPTHRNI